MLIRHDIAVGQQRRKRFEVVAHIVIPATKCLNKQSCFSLLN
jgi:hypothetical protein